DLLAQWWHFCRMDAHIYRQLAGGISPKNTMCWWHIGIVPPDCHANMPFVDQTVVGGIKADPALTRYERLNPGVRGSICRAITSSPLVEKIPTHITAGNPQLTHYRDHNVREILAHSPPDAQCIVNGRIDLRVLFRIGKRLVNCAVDLFHCAQRIILSLYIQLLHQFM